MPKGPRRPQYHDIQPPKLYQAGLTLRRSYTLGPADTQEEAAMKEMLEGVEQPEKTALFLRPLTPEERK